MNPAGPPSHQLGFASRLQVRRGAGPSLSRWHDVVSEDLAMVDDVRIVRRRAELELSAAVADEDGRRLLRARLVDPNGTAHYEETFDLGASGDGRAALERAGRLAAHRTVDGLLERLTGERGGFYSSIVFARRISRRRKDVLRTDSDGWGLWRISSGRSIAMLPALAGGDVWYSVIDQGGLFLTRATVGETPLISGLAMGVRPCGPAHVVFSDTRDGDSEIYRASTDLTEVVRLTEHPGIDVSPSCGPGGEVAFVSNREGGPRIHVLADGESPRAIVQPDTENQTPVICENPARPIMAFTQVHAGQMSVWTMPLGGGEASRVSPGHGRFKDPAFSPDCRLIAYVGDEGIYISSLSGRHRRLIVRGPAETVRWGAFTPPVQAPPDLHLAEALAVPSERRPVVLARRRTRAD